MADVTARSLQYEYKAVRVLLGEDSGWRAMGDGEAVQGVFSVKACDWVAEARGHRKKVRLRDVRITPLKFGTGGTDLRLSFGAKPASFHLLHFSQLGLLWALIGARIIQFFGGPWDLALCSCMALNDATSLQEKPFILISDGCHLVVRILPSGVSAM